MFKNVINGIKSHFKNPCGLDSCNKLYKCITSDRARIYLEFIYIYIYICMCVCIFREPI